MRGHVRERGKGNWYAVIEQRDPATNKRKRKWIKLPGVKGKREADIACAKIITEIKGGTHVDPSKLSWARLSEQIFRIDKWSLCRG
jgi:hypothetical protein